MEDYELQNNISRGVENALSRWNHDPGPGFFESMAHLADLKMQQGIFQTIQMTVLADPQIWEQVDREAWINHISSAGRKVMTKQGRTALAQEINADFEKRGIEVQSVMKELPGRLALHDQYVASLEADGRFRTDGQEQSVIRRLKKQIPNGWTARAADSSPGEAGESLVLARQFECEECASPNQINEISLQINYLPYSLKTNLLWLKFYRHREANTLLGENFVGGAQIQSCLHIRQCRELIEELGEGLGGFVAWGLRLPDSDLVISNLPDELVADFSWTDLEVEHQPIALKAQECGMIKSAFSDERQILVTVWPSAWDSTIRDELHFRHTFSGPGFEIGVNFDAEVDDTFLNQLEQEIESQWKTAFGHL